MDANREALKAAAAAVLDQFGEIIGVAQVECILRSLPAALSHPPAVAVPEGWTISGPYQYSGETHPSLRIDSPDRIVASVYIHDNDEVAARLIAERIASPSAPQADPLSPIRQAIADYHYALDTRQHEGLAIDEVMETIFKAVIDMRWEPGAEKARRDAAQEGGK